MAFAAPTLTLIAGPNGSGKTRLSETLINEQWFPANSYINPDHIARHRYGDWDSSTARQKAIVHAAGLVKGNLKILRSFALETVLSPSGVSLLRRASRTGFITHLYFIGTTDPTINIARVAARTRAGGHDIPERTIIRRYHEALDTLPDALDTVDHAFVYDNSQDDRPMTRLFHTVGGRITEQFTTPLPRWAQKAIETLR